MNTLHSPLDNDCKNLIIKIKANLSFPSNKVLIGSSSSLEDSFEEKPEIRISTAPARPLTEIEEFKRSREFLILEQAVFASNSLLQKNYQKIDLDSNEGQKLCKNYLSLIEKLCEAFRIRPALRTYRENFSKAYKVLYKEGSLCYLIEILDSAQEAFPYLWVNGEKYIFSSNVLEEGENLLLTFNRTHNTLRNSYNKLAQDFFCCNLEAIKLEIIIALEDLDNIWTKFEHIYVNELMIIEKKARRMISDSITIEKEIQAIELREKMRGKILLTINDAYNAFRRKLVNILAQINSVANIEGKGRDDLDLEILLEAEGILRRISKEQSKAIRNLAESVRNSFMNFRLLLRRYEENIEMVDPQLKNNLDLIEVLQEYEKTWEKGKHYFLETKKCTFLINFSHMIESTAEKYKEFQEKLECREADIFVIIPRLLILKFLDNDDKMICTYFLPQIIKSHDKINNIYIELNAEFKEWKRLNLKKYEYYNSLEKVLVGIHLNEQEKNNTFNNPPGVFDKILHKIKLLAMELERSKPLEWNDFLDASLFS